MYRIGVFICHCGSNIAGSVKVGEAVAALSREPGVVHIEDYPYMCSEAGQQKIKQSVEQHKLTGIVICSCSPRMHEATFRKAAAAAGINPYMVEIANIREQCSWIHKEKEEATRKAVVLAQAAIAKVRFNSPLTAGRCTVTKRALVIGGGIAGLQTAIDISDAGYLVDIIEKSPSLGGRMAQLDKTFPTLDCSACILTPKMVEAATHERIRIYTYSEVEEVSGFVGNFTVSIRKKARSVDLSKCTGCGVCSEKCPSKKNANEFNQGLSCRSAIYTPFAQAIPNVPVIERSQCIRFQTGKCGLCEKVCPSGAIDFEQVDELITETYGAVVAATGFQPISLEKFGEYGYHLYPDVITSLELERLTNAAGPTQGHLERLSDHQEPRSITFIQCVGSRGVTCRDKSYCSKICCMYTAKHAMLLRDKYPDVKVQVFYIDVRTPGKNFDEFYRRAAEEYGVQYIKGQVGKITEKNGQLQLQASNLLSQEVFLMETDLVVLATAIEPDSSVRRLATLLTASIDTNHFLTEAHPKLKPVESPTAGVFLAGVCQGPKDIPETVSQAGAAAAKVIGILAKDYLVTNPCTAMPDHEFCSGCSACQNVCPYGAISYEVKDIRRHKGKEKQRMAVVNTALCQGCGACTVVCPCGAMDLQGFSNRQILAEVDAICR